MSCEKGNTLNKEIEGAAFPSISSLGHQALLIKQFMPEAAPWGSGEPRDSVDNEDLLHKQKKFNA